MGNELVMGDHETVAERLARLETETVNQGENIKEIRNGIGRLEDVLIKNGFCGKVGSLGGRQKLILIAMGIIITGVGTLFGLHIF